MKKIDAEKVNVIVDRINLVVLFISAAVISLFNPRKAAAELHRALCKRYLYIIERDDIGDGAYKRWMKGNDKMNQADCRKCLNVIRDHFKILIGEVKK